MAPLFASRALAATDACATPAIVFAAGIPAELICADSARDRNLSLVDLSDDWTPRVLGDAATDAPESHQRYRATYLALADERPEQLPATQRFERHLELFGVSPTFRVLRQRLLDEDHHRCDEAIDVDPARSQPWLSSAIQSARAATNELSTRASEPHPTR